MYPPIYRFDHSDRRMFFELVRRANGVELKDTDVLISHPKIKSQTHTAVMLSPTEESPLTGQVEVFYDRLDLNHFFFGIPLSFSGLSEITPVTITTAILHKWAVFIDPDDIMVYIESFYHHHPKRVKLIVKDTSLTWVGNIEAWVLPDGYLGDLFKDSHLSFNDYNVKQNAFLYSIDRQVNAVSQETIDFLIEGVGIHTLTTETQILLNELTTLTGDEWTITQDIAPFNLYGASVVYHDLYDPEDTLNYVIVIRLGGRCKNLFGHLLIHYSLPENDGV